MKRDAWFTIEQTYTDEFGEIDRESLAAAGQIWPQARPLAISILRDEQAGHARIRLAVSSVRKIFALCYEKHLDRIAIRISPCYILPCRNGHFSHPAPLILN